MDSVGLLFCFFLVVRCLEHTEMPDNMKVGFIGDTAAAEDGYGKVLDLLMAEGVDMILHQGDLGYGYKPKGFFKKLESKLDPDFPYFASIGDHDEQWFITNGYQDRLWDRLKSQNLDKHCEGNLGVMSVCDYNGLLFVQLGTGVNLTGVPNGKELMEFIDQTFTENPAKWKVCGQFKPAEQFEIRSGGIRDYSQYEMCRKHGAIMATAHHHSYSRTFQMQKYSENPLVADFDPGSDKDKPLMLTEGENFAFVCGTGGNNLSIGDAVHEGSKWWAAERGGDQGLNYGALICTFRYEGDPDYAFCEFKQIDDGGTLDQFYIKSTLEDALVSTNDPTNKSNDPKATEENPPEGAKADEGGNHMTVYITFAIVLTLLIVFAVLFGKWLHKRRTVYRQALEQPLIDLDDDSNNLNVR